MINIKLLLIEDNIGDTELVKFYFDEIHNLEIEHFCVRYLKEAKDFLKKKKVDIILSDLNLPDSSALDTLRAIRDVAGDTPIVVLTEIESSALGVLAIKEGAQDYIEKEHLNSKILKKTLQYAIERARLTSVIKHLVVRDSLTNLYNRAYFLERLETELNIAKKYNEKLGILFFDLDNFKKINDTLGHPFGDKIIQIFSKKLRIFINEKDILARIGGDEFIIAIPQLESIKSAIITSKEIIELFQQPIVLEDNTLYVSASIGIAIFPDNGIDSETLIKHADIAMYEAKRNSDKRYSLYTPQMNKAIEEQFNLSNAIRSDDIYNQLSLNFQPILEITEGKIERVEVLLRWKHPILGQIPPDKFIPVAEKCDVIVQIGYWVIKNACSYLREWIDQGYKSIICCINISVRQIEQTDFVSNISKILDVYNISPTFIELEITESISMQDNKYIVKTLKTLKSLGFSISIDDFGTGYTSLTQLKDISIDTIKIDRSFISEIEINAKSNSNAIVNAILSMGHNLDLQVVAEGVETENQYRFLVQNNCDLLQGYLFSKPLEASAFKKLMKKVSLTN